MKNIIKWTIIVCGGVFLLIVIILLLVPLFFDANQFKPKIENMITEETGRPFSINGEIDLSLFPWAGLSCENASMGNPEGFKEKEFASIQSLDLRVKLLPLLSRDVQLSFVLQSPKFALITRKNGKVNYDFSQEMKEKDISEKKSEKPKAEKKTGQAPSIKSLTVEKFLISDGQVLIIDHAKDTEKKISDITAKLDNVSLDQPISFLFSAQIDQIPFSLNGELGPVGQDLGKGEIPVDIIISASKELEIKAKGLLTDITENPKFILDINSNAFSAKKLAKALNQDADIQTADADVLKKISFGMHLSGTPETFELTKGSLLIDDTTVSFECRAKAFEKPDIQFTARLDKVDVDGYLPPAQTVQVTDTPAPKKPVSDSPAETSGKTDYRPLRSVVLDGNLSAGEIRISGMTMNDLKLKVTGKNGIFKIDPLSIVLYGGAMNLTSILNVQSDLPKTSVVLKADKIQANPLVKAILDKDIIEGGLKADMDIRMAGDDPAAVKRSLNGRAHIAFNDGAIKGVNLTAMAQNIKSAFGGAQTQTATAQARTDFSELIFPLDIQNGIVGTTDTKLVSPLLRVTVKGKADLVKEILDFKVDPKFVATISGQGDTIQRSGVMVPVLITGSFSSPKFAPDVGGIIKQSLEGGIPSVDDLKNIIKGEGDKQTGGEESPQNLEDTAKDLLKKLPFGQ